METNHAPGRNDAGDGRTWQAMGSVMGTGTRRAAILAAILLVASIATVAAGASETAEITVKVVAPKHAALSVAIGGASFSEVAYRAPSGAGDGGGDGRGAQDSVGTLTLYAEDTRGVGTGWTVSVAASGPFVSVSDGVTDVIGLDHLSLEAGQVAGLNGEPIVGISSSSAGSMSAPSPQAVLVAQPRTGMGQFHGSIGARISVPDGTLAGAYRTTLTVTIVAGQ